jgi:4-diphosphocytidyl-2-C-methyl-D-erythritol kinase
MRVRALAKINLSLRVLGRRADGYHELRTIFQSIALHDTLTIRRARGRLTLDCDEESCPAGRTNLVWRAAAAVWKASGRRGPPRNIAIALRKRIPIAAGLGGGSSDAAATLRALAKLWRVDGARLPDLARPLGADVPYFLEGGTVLGLERGDALFPLIDRPRAWVTLVVPPFHVSTNDAYAWWDAERRRDREDHLNDLERPVARRHPEIAPLVRALRRAGASHAAMTGSGSAVFGLFDSARAAVEAGDALARRMRSRSRIIVTRTVTRADYRRLVGK